MKQKIENTKTTKNPFAGKIKGVYKIAVHYENPKTTIYYEIPKDEYDQAIRRGENPISDYSVIKQEIK